MQLNYRMKSNGMYILSRKDCDNLGEVVLQEYMPLALERPRSVDITCLATECLYLDIKDRYITLDGSVLGAIAFGDTRFVGYGPDHEQETIELPEGTILIDYSLLGQEKKGRRRYTLAHECSHWICHRTYHSSANRIYEFRKNGPGRMIACRTENIEVKRTADSYKNFTDSDWEEWQADSLAAAILMPRRTFAEGFRDAMRHVGVRQNYLIKGDDEFVEREVIRYLMKVFEVSYTATEIRLKNLGLMREYSYDKNWGYGY